MGKWVISTMVGNTVRSFTRDDETGFDDAADLLEDFMLAYELTPGDKLIVERAADDGDVVVISNVQGVQIGPNGVQNNTFVSQKVRAGRDAYVSAGVYQDVNVTRRRAW